MADTTNATTSSESQQPAEGVSAQGTVSKPPEDSKPPVEAKPQVEDPRFASKFAALTRKEKEIKAQENLIKQQMAELDQARKQGELTNKEFQEIKELAKTKRMEVLRRLGISWDDLSEEVLRGEEPPKKKEAWEERLDAVSKRLEETEGLLKAKEEKEESERKSKEKQDYDEKLEQFYTGLERTIEKEFPLVSLFNARDTVVQVIEQTWETSKKVLSNEEACRQVEEWFEQTVGKASALDKFKKNQTDASSETPSTQGKEGTPAKNDPSTKQSDKKSESKGPSPTLGNKSGTPPTEKSMDDMDYEEKRDYLAAKMRKMKGK
jgi:hypothetical protein